MGTPEGSSEPRPPTMFEGVRRASNETAETAETLVAPAPGSVVMMAKDGNGEVNEKIAPSLTPALNVEEEPPAGEIPTGLKLMIVIASVVVVMFLVLLDMSIIVTAIPKITSDFHSLPDVGWYGAAYQLSSACLQPLTGKLYTYLRTKWTFLVFFAIFELGSLICGAANSSPMLIVGRAILGIGASGLTNGALMIISGIIPLAKRPLYFGIMFGISQLGLISGPLVGGALTEYATWRWCFYINLPIGAVLIACLTMVHIPEQTPKPRFTLSLVRRLLRSDLDLPGFAIFAPSQIMLLLGLQFGGNAYAWGSPTVVGLLVGAVVGVILFGAYEYFVAGDERAMVPPSVLGTREVWTGSLFIGGLMGNVLLASFYLPIYFQGVRGHSPLQSGVDVLPSILSQLLLAVVSGALVSKMGYYLPWALACGAIAAVGSGLLSTLTPSTPTATWIGYQIIVGAGRGMGLQVAILAVQTVLPPSQLSLGMSILVFGQNLFAALLLTLGTAVFTNALRSELASRAPGVPADAVVAAGSSAHGVDALFQALGLEGDAGARVRDAILLSYTSAVSRVFYVAVGLAVLCFIVAPGLGWRDVRETKTKEVKREEERAAEV